MHRLETLEHIYMKRERESVCVAPQDEIDLDEVNVNTIEDIDPAILV